MKSTCSDTTLLGSFLENHDNPRFASLTSDYALDKNAIAFAMLADGIPILYQGQEQHFSGSAVPNNREAVWLSGYSTTTTLYPFITRLNAIRKQAIIKDGTYVTYKANPVYSDSSTIVMRKGQVISVFTNKGASSSTYKISLSAAETGFSAGQSITELFSCTTLTTDSSSNLQASISAGLPLVFYPSSQLASAAICPSSSQSISKSRCIIASATNTMLQPPRQPPLYQAQP